MSHVGLTLLNRLIDWVLNQGTIFNTNSSGGELALILTQNNDGTRISSTRYVHYGKITATRARSFALVLFESYAPYFLSISEDGSMGRCCHGLHYHE
jgi:hypothetical protein